MLGKGAVGVDIGQVRVRCEIKAISPRSRDTLAQACGVLRLIVAGVHGVRPALWGTERACARVCSLWSCGCRCGRREGGRGRRWMVSLAASVGQVRSEIQDQKPRAWHRLVLKDVVPCLLFACAVVPAHLRLLRQGRD